MADISNVIRKIKPLLDAEEEEVRRIEEIFSDTLKTPISHKEHFFIKENKIKLSLPDILRIEVLVRKQLLLDRCNEGRGEKSWYSFI
jgi:hypothetical protein